MGEAGLALRGMGQDIRGALTGVADANYRREQTAKQDEQDAYNRREREEMKGLQMPGLQLASEQAKAGLSEHMAEQERLNKPATFGGIFADTTDEQGNPVLSARVMEQAGWSRKDREGDPPAKKILKKPMMDAVADVFGAKYMTEGPNKGQYVKASGDVVSEREKEQKQDELQALFLARTDEGRLIRHMKNKAEEGLQTTGDYETYRKQMTEIANIEANPIGRIQRLQKKIEVLSQFKTKEAKAGVERAKMSLEKHFDKLSASDKEKWVAMGNLGILETGSGKRKYHPESIRKKAGEKELSPSQQIQEMKLNALKIITNPNASVDQKKQAASDLQKISGKDSRREAIDAMYKNLSFIDLDFKEKNRQIAELEQLFSETKISGMAGEGVPGPDVSSKTAVSKALQDGAFGDPSSKEAMDTAEKHLDALDAKGI